ncbi:hypothetical protein JL721_5900 [Aureococcus anophagefferens]|nr:hypothetical protein JL721_5900 [Aureococcus anophagefferens]
MDKSMDPPGGKRRSLLSRATHKIGKRVLRRGSTTKPDNDLKAPKPAAPKADNLFRSEAGTASAASPTGRTLAARQELREHFKDMAKEKAVFCHSFPTDRSLGFTICVARYGESGRRFIQVDATSPACDLYNKLKPSDELIAINDQLIYDVDEAGANVVKAAIKSSADRRVKLTFVKGEHRDAADRDMHASGSFAGTTDDRRDSILDAKSQAERLPGSSLREDAAHAEANAYDAQLSASEAIKANEPVEAVKAHVQRASDERVRAQQLADQAHELAKAVTNDPGSKHYAEQTRLMAKAHAREASEAIVYPAVQKRASAVEKMRRRVVLEDIDDKFDFKDTIVPHAARRAVGDFETVQARRKAGGDDDFAFARTRPILLESGKAETTRAHEAEERAALERAPPTILRSGDLHKQSTKGYFGKKTWLKRFFELVEDGPAPDGAKLGRLRYRITHASEANAHARGTIVLDDTMAVPNLPVNGGFAFDVEHADRNGWIAAISGAVAAARRRRERRRRAGRAAPRGPAALERAEAGDAEARRRESAQFVADVFAGDAKSDDAPGFDDANLPSPSRFAVERPIPDSPTAPPPPPPVFVAVDDATATTSRSEARTTTRRRRRRPAPEAAAVVEPEPAVEASRPPEPAVEEETPAAVVEEPEPAAVEETPAAVVEEPAAVVEEETPAAVVEEPEPIVEEPAAVGEETPAPDDEEPEPIVEEPEPVVEKAEPAAVVEPAAAPAVVEDSPPPPAEAATPEREVVAARKAEEAFASRYGPPPVAEEPPAPPPPEGEAATPEREAVAERKAAAGLASRYGPPPVAEEPPAERTLSRPP